MAGIRGRDFGHIRKVKRKTAQRGYVFEASFPNPRYGEPGESRRVSTTRPKKSEADSWLSNQRDSINAGTWRSPLQRKKDEEAKKLHAEISGRTFADFVDTWRETNGHKPSVQRTDESTLRVHLLPRWGETPINEITREDVLLWGTKELAPGRPGARRNAYGLFSAIMGMAEELGTVTASPCTRRITTKVMQSCTAIKSSRHDPRALSSEEVTSLRRELPPSTEPLFFFMLLTGLRIGEARELRWKDVDFDAQTVTVSRGVTGDGNSIVVSTPKTKKSARVKVLGETSLRILEEAREKQGRAVKNGLIFPSQGDPSKHFSAALFNKNLRNACERLGIPHTSAHDLRHTWADVGGRIAESLKDVTEGLGQTSTTVTGRYLHTTDEVQRTLQRGIEARYSTRVRETAENVPNEDGA